MNRQEYINLIKRICGAKPATNLANIDIESYISAFQGIPWDILKKAELYFMRSPGEFMPGAGTIVDKCLDLMDDNPSPEEAWALTLEHIKGYKELNTLPERGQSVLRGMGGKNALQKQDNEGYFRKQFIDAYKEQSSRDKENWLLTNL